jgi:phosphatidylserine/phosphatidylglycerophosphate/cardiolipin synthase-like enzyme
VRVDDAPLAKWFRDLFEADWDIPAMPGPGQAVVIPPELLEPILIPSAVVKAPSDVFDLKKFQQATVTPVVSPDNYYDRVKTALTSATQSIYVEQQYILAGGRVSDLLKIVEQRRAAGVDVRVIVSPAFRKTNARDNWEISRETLDAFGLVDCLRALSLEYFTHCHNKGVIIDRKIAVVSSTNWSKNSIQAARETGLLIESSAVAEYYARVFDLDWDELSWDQADVPDNLMRLAADALFAPGGFEPVSSADWV